eukprot:c5558_g1_i1.p1 GENE.c5558_g1_i1~~c5558_g1_i1.p1  ORF type:complete len:780 (-),score=175.21 c5558_g1_i1:15-2114(-)
MRDMTQASAACGEADNQITACLNQLDQLLKEHQSLIGRVAPVHQACSKLCDQRASLSRVIDLIDTNLVPFKEAEICAHELQHGNLDVFDDRFTSLLCRLDAGMHFMTHNKHFSQSSYYLSTFRHLQARALTMTRNHVLDSVAQRTLEVTQEIQTLRKSKSGEPISESEQITLLFSRFHAIAPPLKALMEEIESRQGRKELLDLLTECHKGFVRHRYDLLTRVVGDHISSLVAQSANSLLGLTSKGVQYLKNICMLEAKLFEAVFDLDSVDQSNRVTHPRAARSILEEHLMRLCVGFMDVMRPLVIKQEDVSCLCAVLGILQVERNNQHLPSNSGAPLIRRDSASSASSLSSTAPPDTFAYHRMIKALVCDAQERLIYRVHLHVRNCILDFSPKEEDLDYPNILEKANGASGDSVLYPSLRQTLELLTNLHKCLDVRVFEGLAQDAVNACTTSLRSASALIAKKRGNTDGFLFLIKHLLILRERIAPFDVNFTFTERVIDFKNMRDYLASLLKTPGSLLNIKQLTHAMSGLIGEVRIMETKQNPKKDVERGLKEACESLISIMSQSIAGDLLALLSEMSSFVKSKRQGLLAPGDDDLKKQTFAQLDHIRKVLVSLEQTIATETPKFVLKMRLYLGDVSTLSVLFKPVRTQVVEAYGSLRSFIQAEFLEDEWKGLDLPSTQKIAESLSISSYLEHRTTTHQ